MLMASGINFGFRLTIPHMLGVSIGFTFMILLVGIGVMQFINAVPGSRTTITLVSGFYLLYMAWKIATTDTSSADSDSVNTASKPFTFLQAALFQWVNPKAWTMALTGISAYAPKDQWLDRRIDSSNSIWRNKPAQYRHLGCHGGKATAVFARSVAAENIQYCRCLVIGRLALSDGRRVGSGLM